MNDQKKQVNNTATMKVHHVICNKKKNKGNTARESKPKNCGNLAESRHEAFAVGIAIMFIPCLIDTTI